ncbi:hypothetical protein [Streptomyces sp. NPDC057413]|uniref:hypothetical protein n=1 Tax=Streptomyces sp. NPDC057413 TaxID=3346124 RepID=UPI00369FB240
MTTTPPTAQQLDEMRRRADGFADGHFHTKTLCAPGCALAADVRTLLVEVQRLRDERDAYRERALDAENRCVVDGREVCADCGKPVPDGPCGVHSPDAVFQRGAQEAARLRAERDQALAQRNNVFATNEQLLARVEDAGQARIHAENEARKLHHRIAELEAAAKQIQRLHTDSPMGPCPVCVDADRMAAGEDYTMPYPCPTARLAGAQDCDPPSFRTRREEAQR